MNLNCADYGVLYSIAKQMDLLTLLNFTYATKRVNRLLSDIWKNKLEEEFSEIVNVQFSNAIMTKSNRVKYITLQRIKEKSPYLISKMRMKDSECILEILRLGIETTDFYLMDVGSQRTKVFRAFLDEDCIKEILKNKKIYPDFIMERIKDVKYLEYLVKIKNYEGLFYLIKYEKGPFSIYDLEKLLSLICEKGMINLTKYLVEERKCDVNFGNGDILKSAVWSGNLELVKYLIDKGANINLRNCSYIKIASKRGFKEIENYISSIRAF